MHPIEIEFRSILSYSDFLALQKKLEQIAVFQGNDDKDVYFFLLDNKLLKISNNISQRGAKVTLKLNQIGHGSAFQEIEFPISMLDTEKAVSLFRELGFNKIQKSFQSRKNYLYKGVTISLKYSEAWKYHIELEVIIDRIEEQRDAEQKIYSIAEELDVRLMNDDEIIEFTSQYNSNYEYESEKAS